MTTTTFRLVHTPPGMKGHFIHEITDGVVGEEILHLPDGTAPEALFDTVAAIQHAYRKGLDDVAKPVWVPEKLREAYRPGGELHKEDV